MRALIPILVLFVGLGAKSVVDERLPHRWGTSDRVVVIRLGDRLSESVVARQRNRHSDRDARACRDRRLEEVEQVLIELIAEIEANRSRR